MYFADISTLCHLKSKIQGQDDKSEHRGSYNVQKTSYEKTFVRRTILSYNLIINCRIKIFRKHFWVIYTVYCASSVFLYIIQYQRTYLDHKRFSFFSNGCRVMVSGYNLVSCDFYCCYCVSFLLRYFHKIKYIFENTYWKIYRRDQMIGVIATLAISTQWQFILRAYLSYKESLIFFFIYILL